MAGAASWSNWAGLHTASPVDERFPVDPGEVVEAVLEARRRGLGVKMVGSGHSFSDVAVTDGLLLRPDRLTGVIGVDRDAMTVTVLAGTPLHALNADLERLGLSLHNMGDIAAQTVAGAVSTGTHGTGGVVASLSSQLAGLELVTADGTLLRASATEHADVLAVARVGLGALGVLTTLTFQVEPLFVLEAHEEPMDWDTALASFDELAERHHHMEMYWFPHTERVQCKQHDRTLEDARPIGRARGWVQDELLANRAFAAINAVGNRAPRMIPRLNRVSAAGLAERRYADVAHRALTAHRTVRFREMEYALPREAGLAALRDVRALIERSDWRISFPVEIRTAPADDVPLSPASGRDTLWLAVHTNAATDHTAYFAGVEGILRGHGGRPHWGKLHTRTAADLAPAYPRWQEFASLRDRLDPERLFTNAYLRRVLGD